MLNDSKQKSTILTVAIPNDLMEVIKAQAEKKRVGYSTLIRMIVAEALSKRGREMTKIEELIRFLKEKYRGVEDESQTPN